MALTEGVRAYRSEVLQAGMAGRARRLPTVIIVATVANHLRALHLPWVRVLRERGFRVCGVASDITGCSACQSSFDEVVDIPFSRSALSFKQAALTGYQLRELKRRLGASLVHFHTPNAAFWGRLALRQDALHETCKIAYTAHGFHFHKNGHALTNSLYRAAERFAAQYTHALLTVNPDDAAQAGHFKLAAGGFTELLPGTGLDINRFNPANLCRLKAREELCASIGVHTRAALIVMVAELIPRKRHGDAIKALATTSMDQMHLLLAGIGREEGKLRSQVKELGVSDRVHFLGFRGDIPELVSAADAVILPSEQEGLPVCVLETMAMERPVIVANTRGSRDLVLPDCGWVHDIGNYRALAALLQQVLKNPEEARERGRKARERVISHYAWPLVQERLVSVYRRLGVAV